MNRLALFRMVLALAAAIPGLCETLDELREQVRRTEAAFAKTMADRDHTAFVSYLADDAIFFSQSGAAFRGAAAIAQAWKPFYEAAQAPFSWAPERVEVLASGTLAISFGPVKDAASKRVATFTSVWRREPDGSWRIVLDKGCRVCDCAP